MEHIQLPDWVVARLRQDNSDIAQAIVDMVVWADRVKCWMFQADADFERIKNLLERNPKARPEEDDFYKESRPAAGSSDDYDGPLYGEMKVSQPAQDTTSGRNQARRPAKDSGGVEF